MTSSPLDGRDLLRLAGAPSTSPPLTGTTLPPPLVLPLHGTALSLGLLNGDLFTHVIALSPGFMTGGSRRRKPRLFGLHGVHDRVLPIDLCSRRAALDGLAGRG